MQIERVESTAATLQVFVRSCRDDACCPVCHRASTRARSSYLRSLTDLRRPVTVRLRWCSVWLPHHAQPLTLVIVRHPTRTGDWRLVTNLPVHTAAQAMHIAQISARRWQVEWSLRFLKSELAVESPRLQIWERREKLLALVFLVYAWFVHLLVDHDPLVQQVLEAESHRTGRRSRLTYAPLYRVRHALARLLIRYLPTPALARRRMATR